MGYFKWKLECASHILWVIASKIISFDSNLFQILSNLILLTCFVTLRRSTLFQAKIRAIELPRKSSNLHYLVATFPMFSLRLKYGIKIIASLFGTYFRKKNKILAEIWLFFANLPFNKKIKSENKISGQSVS